MTSVILVVVSLLMNEVQGCIENDTHCHLLDTVHRQMKQLEKKFNELPQTPPKSCKEIKELLGTCPSGYYDIQVDGRVNETVYCDMEGVNCDGEGGWTRVGYLDMSDPSEQCPARFRLYEEKGIRACGRNDSGCQSVEFPSYDINYTQVCGRVTGYQQGTPDAIFELTKVEHNDINEPYIDGVSITRGTTRHHVWTFMAGLMKNNVPMYPNWLCPCSPNNSVTPQSFIGNDYFCEAGNPTHLISLTTYYTEPLWDGKQCGLVEVPCCDFPGIPWFNKVLPQPTTDYIELRVCADQPQKDEDAPVGYYEIYVK